jgi:hypothetical protein
MKGIASFGADFLGNSLSASHRWRTVPLTVHALLPSMTSRRVGSGGCGWVVAAGESPESFWEGAGSSSPRLSSGAW